MENVILMEIRRIKMLLLKMVKYQKIGEISEEAKKCMMQKT